MDFLWSRCICKVLSKDKFFNIKEQELICVLAIEYFANYHSKNFFHGDIKPENILVSKLFELTSDAGTLLSLGEDLDNKDIPRYLINQYTKFYASSEHIYAVENKIPLSRK